MSRTKLYKSKVWKDITYSIWIKQHCLCARCHQPVYVSGISNPNIPIENRVKGIVHHKKYLTDSNYLDDYIAYNEENLEGLCITCHNQEHFTSEILRSDVKFNENGDLVEISPL